MKKSICVFTYLVMSLSFFSQGNVGPSNVIIPNGQPASGVVDGVYEKKDVLAKKRAIPYEFVRENDYVWGKRTWSYIDMREKINHPLYYPHEEKLLNGEIRTKQSRYSLYYILRNALFQGQLMGYFDTRGGDINNPIFESGGDAFIMPAKRDYSISANSDANYLKDISTMTAKMDLGSPQPKLVLDPNNNNQASPVYHLKGTKNKIDMPKEYRAVDAQLAEQLDPSSETFDPTNAELDAASLPAPVDFKIITETPYMPNQIIKYLLKEDWFFDKERSILDVRTIGLAPVVKGDTADKVLFWVYFPQARDVLKNYYVYDPKSTVGGNTFDHLFMTRRFNAVIYKESTLYDRAIEDYRFGADALYESEKVKNTIRTFEHDVWNF